MLVAGVTIGWPEEAKVNDPTGILRKPIPDKLIVLTFDDACASGYTVVAPILKSLGFNGSFYVCDFDSFKTRKDWYLTWRQMKELDAEGFEIGNHTVGHGGGLGNFLAMEDELFANNGPRMTTVCWPIYAVNWDICPTLSTNGYTFGRGGHERPYRPTIDNPFDVPSFTMRESLPLETFAKQAQQACQGRVVVYCFHGVPDGEHPPVGVEPETFKVMMQYLKDNNYKCIAMRDLVEYIDPVKAAKLPHTTNEVKNEDPFQTNKDDKPCGAVVRPVREVNTNPTRERKPVVYKTTNMLVTNVHAATAVKSDKPNVFTWNRAESGNWSDVSNWSNNLDGSSTPVSAGQSDYILNFNQHGSCAVKNDLNAGFLLNQLVLGDGCRGMKLGGNSIVFTRNRANGIPPAINADKCGIVDINVPVNLQDDLNVNTPTDKDPNCFISFNDVISGSHALILNSSGDPNVAGINFHDVHFGILQINSTNTYSGGTFVNGGKINVRWVTGLGTGPVTLDYFGTLSSDVTLTNPLTINSGSLFHCSWSGPITLNGTVNFIGNCHIYGGMSGAGGVIMRGVNGTYLSMVPGGTVTLYGTNTYSGPTMVFPGTLIVKKAAGLYNGEAAKWTPANITVHKAATLRLNVGGLGEFTGEQVGMFLGNLTTSINNNGLMGGSFLFLDVANAKEAVIVSTNITDSKGPGGGAFLIKKCGTGTIRLSGKNTYTGQTILESGALSVSSLNSYTKGKASSSLGAPTDTESGEIVIGEEGKDGDCALIYTGAGETSDRVMNLAGKNSTVTFDQSGTGLLKLTSTFVISGYGASKTIVLKGDTAGNGEIRGNIVNPHDRAGKATTAVVKSGTDTWTLSGTNSYTGPTTVTKGTLSLASAHSLGEKTEVRISEDGMLELNFKGDMSIGKLYLDGKLQPAGKYGAANIPNHIKGTGILTVHP